MEGPGACSGPGPGGMLAGLSGLFLVGCRRFSGRSVWILSLPYRRLCQFILGLIIRMSVIVSAGSYLVGLGPLFVVALTVICWLVSPDAPV